MREAQGFRWGQGGLARAVVAAALLAGLGAAAQAQGSGQGVVPGPITISFDSLQAGPWASYAEDGFLVTATTSNWRHLAYGKPSNSIYFAGPADGSITVTRGGDSFRFDAIDLYSSVTRIPYRIRGFLGGQQVFELAGEHPNTFGDFATVASPSTAFIDVLTVTLTNPVVRGWSNNPMGLDNITFSAVAPVPEPSTLMLGALGLAAIAWRRRLARV